MPRKRIEPNHHIEHLSILDEKGTVDKELDPDLPSALLLKLYRAMVLGRRFDERLLALQRQGRIGTFPPISGQEASQLGAVAVLRPEDWMVPAFRETAAEVWRGRSLVSVILAYAGYSEAAADDPPVPTLPVSIPVGSQMLHAVGIGWAARYRGDDHVALTFFGDGATSEGDFHEAMNFAAVFETPVIFLCQNNQWAISIPRTQQTRSQTIAQKALAYGMAGIQVDGNDILAVYAAVAQAAERARSGGGPTLVECETYRLMMHTTADDPQRYRPDDEVERWRRKDPIARFEIYLKRRRLLTKAKIAAIEQEIREEIQTAVDAAEAKMKVIGDPRAMFDHAYAEDTPDLQAQREAFQTEQAAAAKEGPDA